MAAERNEIQLLLGRPGRPASAAASEPGQAHRVAWLFERHRRALLGYLSKLGSSRVDADDVVQEACLKLMQVAHLDDDPARARRYLFRTAVNVARDMHRRRCARCEALHVEVDEVPLEAETPAPEQRVDAERALKLAIAALHDLSPRARTAFLMHVVDDLTYERIAACLGVSKKTIERDVAMTLEICRVRFARWSASRA